MGKREEVIEARVARLPSWAQRHIAKLENERDNAVRSLDEFEDNQSPAPFYFDDLVCDGKDPPGPTFRRCYINGTTTVELLWGVLGAAWDFVKMTR